MPKKELQGADQATAQRRQQRQGLPAKAAADHARVRGPVAEAAHGRSGGAGEEFRAWLSCTVSFGRCGGMSG